MSAYQNIFVAYRVISQRPLKFFTEHRTMFAHYDHHRGGGCYEYEYEEDSDSGESEPESEAFPALGDGEETSVEPEQ